MTERQVLVLYGSSRGASADAADKFVKECAHHLTTTTDNTNDHTIHVSEPIALDDFLKDPVWAPWVVIFVSSFGSGGGPRNGRQFRRKCDAWKQAHQDNPDLPKPLEGMHFAICGLGDSSYKTYMENPIVVTETLELLGAELVGNRGKADSADGEASQQKTIDEWMESMWEPLREVLSKEPSVSKEGLEKARAFVLDDEDNKDKQ